MRAGVGATVIDGKAVAADVRARVAADVKQLTERLGRAPGLATVLVGEDPASHVYVANKRKACAEAGIESVHHELAANTPQDELEDLIDELNGDGAVDGILVQMPLPDAIDSDRVIEAIDPGKDVDGLHPANAGLLAQGRPGGLVPCTPSGVMELLRSANVKPEGAEAVVVGRSRLVGRPVAALLLAANATVTQCHTRTKDLPGVCRRADILVVAAGRPEIVRGDWVKPGAVVIDVGIHRTDDGLVGDVAFGEVADVAGAITPVPGGVGPMTIAMLLANTAKAASQRAAQD
jgi:methylenetetrahydrofolate dehydrogenase (NADP+)/methenyltetrahydrofolate cyclohydrolase